jgi:hypothetical protein
MSAIINAPGKAMVVSINASTLKSSTFTRQRQGGEIPLPSSGLDPDSDGNYEVPHDVGMIVTTIRVTTIYDQIAPPHAAPYNIRTGLTVTGQFGMTASLLTPAVLYKVMNTTDSNDAERTGLFEFELKPADDVSPGYYS